MWQRSITTRKAGVAAVRPTAKFKGIAKLLVIYEL